MKLTSMRLPSNISFLKSDTTKNNNISRVDERSLIQLTSLQGTQICA